MVISPAVAHELFSLIVRENRPKIVRSGQDADIAWITSGKSLDSIELARVSAPGTESYRDRRLATVRHRRG